MGASVLNLGIAITLKDAFTGVANKIEKSYKSLDNGLEKASKNIKNNLDSIKQGVASMGTGILLASTIKKPLEMATNLESAMARVSTLVDTNVTDMQRLEKEVNNLSILYEGDQIKQADALYTTMVTGITDVNDALEVLHVGNKMATGGVTDITTSIEGLTTVLQAYGLEMENATDIADQFFTAQKLGRTNIEELSQHIGDVAGISKTVGLSTREMFGGVSALATVMGTRKATTGLRQILESILRQSESTKEAAQELGIEWDITTVKTKGFAYMIEQLRPKIEGNEHVVRKLIPGIQGVNAALMLAGGSYENFIEVMEGMGNTADATEEAFNKMTDTFAYKLEVAKSSTKVFFTNLGKALAPIGKAILDVYNRFIAFINMINDKFPALGKAIMLGVGGLSAFLIVLGAVRAMMGIYHLLVPAFNLLIRSIGIQSVVTSSTIKKGLFGVLPPILLVTGLVKLLKKAWTEDWGGIQTNLTSTREKIVLIGTGLTELIKSTKDGMGELSEETYVALEEAGVLDTTITLYMWWYRLKQFVEGFTDGFKNAFETIADLGKRIFEYFGDDSLIGRFLEKIGLLRPSEDSVEGFRRVGEILGNIAGWLVTIFAIVGSLKWIGKGILFVGKILLVPFKIVFKIISLVWRLGKGVFGLGKIVGNVIGFVLSKIGLIGVGILKAFGIVATLPAWLIGLIMIAIVGIIAAMVYAKEYTVEVFKGLGEILLGLVQIFVQSIILALMGIVLFIATVGAVILSGIMYFIGAVITIVMYIVGFFVGLGATIVGVFLGIWETIVMVFDTIANVIAGIFWTVVEIIYSIFTLNFTNLGERLKEIWGETFENIKEVISGWWENVSQIFEDVRNIWVDVMDWVGEKADAVFGWIGEKVEWFAEKLEFLKEIADGITGKIKEGAGKVKEGAVRAWEGVKGGTRKVVDKVTGRGKTSSPTTSTSYPTRTPQQVVGMSTGGQILPNKEGLVWLHPNEVVLNSSLVQDIERFFSKKPGYGLNTLSLPRVTTPKKDNIEKLSYKEVLTEKRALVSEPVTSEDNALERKFDLLITLLERYANRPVVVDGKVELDRREIGRVIDEHEKGKKVRQYKTNVR